MTPSDKNDIARQLERLADEVKDLKMGLSAHKPVYTNSELMKLLEKPSSERQFILYEAIRKGADSETLFQLTKIKHWFLDQMRELVEEEQALLRLAGTVPDKATLLKAKQDGFSDKYLAQILAVPEADLRAARLDYGIQEAWEGVHVSGTQDSAYYYSTYHVKDESKVSPNPNKIMILGGGPNRIGQGIEFDYCCVHASMALREDGFETIMVNCNPETVSTDYDTSDKLYFEPLTVEDVLSIYNKEQPVGVIVQFGGQTPLNIAAELKANGVNILGTSPEVIDLAEDRDRFRPYEKHHSTVRDACEAAEELGVQNLLLYHTEDTDIAHRKQRYLTEGRRHFSGNLYVPDDFEVIDL